MGIKRSLRMLLCTALLSATTAGAARSTGEVPLNSSRLTTSSMTANRQKTAEYLQLNITKIDNAGKFSIYGYGREVRT